MTKHPRYQAYFRITHPFLWVEEDHGISLLSKKTLKAISDSELDNRIQQHQPTFKSFHDFMLTDIFYTNKMPPFKKTPRAYPPKTKYAQIHKKKFRTKKIRGEKRHYQTMRRIMNERTDFID